MKFDFIIGNPPYQDETIGDNKTYTPSIYHKFLDNAYQVSDKVEMIHPARFLFNAGNTPKQWNQKMLNDPHLNVLYYETDSRKLFPNTSIMGGIVITYHDLTKDFGAIETFTPFQELNLIMRRVQNYLPFNSLSEIAFTAYAYKLTPTLHEEHPEAFEMLSRDHAYDLKSNIFNRLPQVFFNEKPDDGFDYIQILGREGNNRAYKFIRSCYVNVPDNLYKYKIFIGSANGASGSLGDEAARLITPPVVGNPSVGNTESFISIGAFDTESEAIALAKYIKTKFTRALLGILKTTQHVTPETWKYVPLQDFTPASDIDWSQSIGEIDRQLYKKYGLDENEIEFIESHVKEMS